MSRLIKAAKRRGKTRVKFKFEMSIHRVQIFRERDKVLIRLTWTKGQNTQSTPWQEGVKRINIDASMAMFATLFERKSGGFQDKASRLVLEMRTERDSDAVIRYGFIDLNLADFAVMNESDSVDMMKFHKQMNLSQCKDKKAFVVFTVHSMFLNQSDRHQGGSASGSLDDEMSVSRQTASLIHDVPFETNLEDVMDSDGFGSGDHEHKNGMDMDGDTPGDTNHPTDPIDDEEIWAGPKPWTEEEMLRDQITKSANREAQLVEEMNALRKENEILEQKLRKSHVEVEQLKRQLSAQNNDPNVVIRQSVMATQKSPRKRQHESRQSMTYDEQFQNLRIVSIDEDDHLDSPATGRPAIGHDSDHASSGDDSIVIHEDEEHNMLQNEMKISQQNSKLWSKAVKKMEDEGTSSQQSEDVKSSRRQTKDFLADMSEMMGLDDEDTQNIIDGVDVSPRAVVTDFHHRSKSFEDDVLTKLQAEFTNTVAEKMKVERQYEDEKERADMLELEITKHQEESMEAKASCEALQTSYDQLSDTLSELEKKYVQVKIDYVNIIDRYHTLEYHQEKLVQMMDDKHKGKKSSARRRSVVAATRENHARSSSTESPKGLSAFNLKGRSTGSALGTIATGNLHSSEDAKNDGDVEGNDEDDMILID